MRFFIERKFKEDPDKEAAIAMKWIQEIKKEQVVNGIVMEAITATTI